MADSLNAENIAAKLIDTGKLRKKLHDRLESMIRDSETTGTLLVGISDVESFLGKVASNPLFSEIKPSESLDEFAQPQELDADHIAVLKWPNIPEAEARMNIRWPQLLELVTWEVVVSIEESEKFSPT